MVHIYFESHNLNDSLRKQNNYIFNTENKFQKKKIITSVIPEIARVWAYIPYTSFHHHPHDILDVAMALHS